MDVKSVTFISALQDVLRFTAAPLLMLHYTFHIILRFKHLPDIECSSREVLCRELIRRYEKYDK